MYKVFVRLIVNMAKSGVEIGTKVGAKTIENYNFGPGRI
jgi:hypothetical protein